MALFIVCHDGVIKYKHFRRYWTFVRGIHRWIPLAKVTQNFVVFFNESLDKRLRKQSRRWWFETTSCSLWSHNNGMALECWSSSCHNGANSHVRHNGANSHRRHNGANSHRRHNGANSHKRHNGADSHRRHNRADSHRRHNGADSHRRHNGADSHRRHNGADSHRRHNGADSRLPIVTSKQRVSLSSYNWQDANLTYDGGDDDNINANPKHNFLLNLHRSYIYIYIYIYRYTKRQRFVKTGLVRFSNEKIVLCMSECGVCDKRVNKWLVLWYSTMNCSWLVFCSYSQNIIE